jgi:2-polyprenyl-6-methoxyphenol hydroxylase-like FAD-dependent oxidoreductase
MIEKPDETNNTDVLIVGAGPAGLMMACQLALHNVSFRIIDRMEHFNSFSGALLIQARTMEVFDQMGIAGKILEKGKVVEKITLLKNGRKSGQINIAKMGSGLSRFPYIFMLKQAHTVRLLADFLKERGIKIERGSALDQFSQDTQHVSVTLSHPGREKEYLKVRYLVGADGIHSHVRTSLGIPWEGSRDPIPLFVTDCRVDEDHGLVGTAKRATIGRPGNEIIFSISQKSIAGFFPLEGESWRIDGIIPEESSKTKEPDFEETTRGLAERLKMNLVLHSPEWFSVFYPNTYLASTYSINRCFLVGDAAHVHTPIGAQGMNTGMQDSYNLAWKMAFVLKHGMSESMLNNYTSERRPVAEKLIHNTDKYFWLAIRKDFTNRFVRSFIIPWFFRLFGFILASGPMQRAFFRRISQTNIHYGPKGSWAGRRWPFIEWTDQAGQARDTHELLDRKQFILMFFHKDKTSHSEVSAAFHSHLHSYKLPVQIKMISYSKERKAMFRKLRIRRSVHFLVRPDGYVALRGNGLDFGPAVISATSGP